MLARVLSAFPVLLVATSLAAGAQNLRNIDGPKELPPAGFGGAQFIDSNGCVFLRAGVNGNTIWVPRVTRSRKLVCGRTPTFAQVETAAQVVTPQPAVQVAAVSTPEPRPTVAPRRQMATTVASNVSASQRVATGAAVLKGFRPAWTDGRLNQNRGARTAAGDAQMALVWTDTVPRRLIEQP